MDESSVTFVGYKARIDVPVMGNYTVSICYSANDFRYSSLAVFPETEAVHE